MLDLPNFGQSGGNSMKKLTMPEPVRYRGGCLNFCYLVEDRDAKNGGMLLLALFTLVPMPSYGWCG